MDHNIDCLLFDCDGTLIDTYDIILEAMRYIVNGELGQDRSDEELMHGVGTPLEDQMRTFLDDESQVDRTVAAYRAYNDSIHDEGVNIFPGVKDGLEALKRAGYRMGVVTSKRHWLADRGLEICGIRDYFEVLIGSDDFPVHKPEPGPILEACRLMGVDPAHCAYIGDSPYDIKAGNAAGCTTIAARWGMFSPESLTAEHPDHEIDTFADLPKLIEALNRTE
ncbi:HAD family hydrolase [Anaerotardibacter muris]|uniref:HAD family hydrolase n=1 Tax=Anaerotardibacter muris TaxID=2941505 RepID=UPI00203CEC79|nr:HAD-IA family hydrolase [Anaerotardibacter muris]